MDEQASEPPVRGLKTVVIAETEQTTVRRYPSVLQPGSISTLSFEVAGRLEEVNLDVGQRISEGDILASLDTTSLEIQVQTAEATLAEMQSLARNAAEDAERKATLLERQVVSRAIADEARTEAETSAARVVQAQRELDNARENLSKAELIAPFDGIINSVEVDSFANVGVGGAVATIYAADAFESSFSVSFEVVNRLAVGKKVNVRLADNPSVVLDGHVSELGARADTVSSFPVVVKLNETDPSMKAGMAVEIAIEFTVPLGEGYSLPLSVLPLDGILEEGQKAEDPGKTQVYVYNPETSTVSRRDVLIAGVRENSIIIVDGLELGERVASAGVSFLRDGQKVKLLNDAN
ncbi:MAG: efflux RND transporter periplasmic adaptor subunit [Pseudomonadota bacterium]